MSLGPPAQPATKTPSVMVAMGSILACFSMNQPLHEQAMPKVLPTSELSRRGSRPAASTTMSTGMRRCMPARVSSTWM